MAEGRELSTATAGGEQVLRVAGDVDLACGPMEVEGELRVEGSILGLVSVRARRITLTGTIEGAQVRSETDLLAAGGIVGNEKGLVVAGRNVAARYIAHAQVRAGGSISAESEIHNSRITCSGRLAVQHGSIFASHVTANGGVTARVIGSPNGTRTIIEAGIDDELRRMGQDRVAEIEARRRQIRRTRSAVEPLMRSPKHLSPAQKEQATELLYEADEQERACLEALAELSNQLEAALDQARPEVYVTATLHAGVIIRFRNVETVIREPLRGPVRLFPKRFGGGEQIVAMEPGTSSTQVLETVAIRDELLAAIRRTISEAA